MSFEGFFEDLATLVGCMDIIYFLTCGTIRLLLHGESLYLFWHAIPTLIKVIASVIVCK